MRKIVELGLTYLVAAAFYAICLIVTFVAWHRSEGTLDIHSIVTRRREVFYWLAVIFTFAMGTALGDLLANTFHLGYLASAFVFTALICVPLAAWRLGASPVLTFWVAYILTRPIGASFADFFGMAKDVSGMGYGHGAVSVVTLILVVASFMYLSRSGIDRPEAAPSPRAPPRPATVSPGTRRSRSRSRSTMAVPGRGSPNAGILGTLARDRRPRAMPPTSGTRVRGPRGTETSGTTGSRWSRFPALSA